LSRLTLALGLALLAVEAAACITLIALTSDGTNRWTTIVLILVVGVTFVASGLAALTRRPDNRTGVYLAAVGYMLFLNGLTSSTNEWVFALGFATEGFIWAPFTALVLAYPTGQLQSRVERFIPVAVGTLLTTTSVVLLLFDPTPAPARCEECPASPIVVAESTGISSFAENAATAGSLLLIVLVAVVLVRRWRAASRASRRLLWPVLASGSATFLAIGLAVIADRFSERLTEALQLVFLVAFTTVPLAFLFGILRTRLARSSVTGVVVALQQGVPLRDAIARALRDPSVEVVYRLDPSRGVVGAGWVDPQGRAVEEPRSDAERAVKVVEHGGEPVAALVYDASLTNEPELVDAVSAGASLAFQNERLQAELRAEVRLTAALADTAPSLLSLIDTDGRILNLNPATRRASGYETEEEVLGRYFWDVFIDPQEREAMIARFHAAAPEFPPAEYENAFTNIRGEKHVIYWHSAPILDDDGRVLSIVSGGLDVTDRYQLEEEKKRERDFLYAIANDAPSLICVIDEEGRVAYRRWDRAEHKLSATNTAFDGLLEIESGAAGGHLFWEHFVDPAEAQEVRQRIQRVVAGEPPEEHDNIWIASSGKRLHVAWSCTPLPRVDERTLFLLSGVDVTERKKREQEAERRGDFLMAITRAVPSFLVAVDPNAVVVDRGSNRAFLEAFGWTEEEIAGRSFLDLVARADDHSARMAIANAANGVPQEERESRWVDRSGEERIVAWTARPVMDHEGRSLVLISGSDITVRQRQEEEIRASRARLLEAESEARRQLERNLHDGAQQRLVALSVQLRLIESRLTDDPEEASKLLTGSRDELSHALEELRELARGIHPAVLTDRGLGPALEALAARAPVPIELTAPDERLAPAVEAAAYYVVAETLTNVAKYARASTAVVNVARENGLLTVTVSDDGVGGADPAAGSGLRGLADRVAALDGALSIASPRGGGTSVRAELPLSEEPEGM
jgi:PAS domain S-box-containing protein